jgi:hypothetical protein
MQEIKIYHSVWRTLLLTLGCAAFVAMAFMMIAHPSSSRWNPIFLQVVGVIGILFFGFGLIVIPSMMIRERITGQAYITISDKSFVVRGSKAFIANFSDVEAFEIIEIGKQKFISVHYKPNVEIQKLEDASFLERLARRFNTNLTGAQEHLTTTGTNIKTEELFEILNERLNNCRNQVAL